MSDSQIKKPTHLAAQAAKNANDRNFVDKAKTNPKGKNAMFYVRKENRDKWDKIANKGEFLNKAIAALD